ncbi:MAG: hypothetical protein K2Y56_23660 [Methylobacterium sp.]|uniref:hypothetical protein n=1 Tax=Methylobacterium sp. TaxID=409 RepID=UPI0025CC3BA3|nr:hypothetical protein [Methylobacterium sp.]MBX9934475.1 hypothetical protein [Methylobacterium sp.]
MSLLLGLVAMVLVGVAIDAPAQSGGIAMATGTLGIPLFIAGGFGALVAFGSWVNRRDQRF